MRYIKRTLPQRHTTAFSAWWRLALRLWCVQAVVSCLHCSLLPTELLHFSLDVRWDVSLPPVLVKILLWGCVLGICGVCVCSSAHVWINIFWLKKSYYTVRMQKGLHVTCGWRKMYDGSWFSRRKWPFLKSGVFSHSLTREGRTMKLQCRRIYTAGQDQPSFQPAALLGRGHPFQTLTYNGSQQWMEMEGNSQHANNKVEPSILVTKAIRYSQATPRIHHFQCQKVISAGRHTAGDNQLTGQQLRPFVFFLHNSIIMHSSWVSEVIAVKSD